MFQIFRQLIPNLDMTLNWIWWWGSNSGVLGIVEYFFVAITFRSTLIEFLSVMILSMGQIGQLKNDL